MAKVRRVRTCRKFVTLRLALDAFLINHSIHEVNIKYEIAKSPKGIYAIHKLSHGDRRKHKR